MNPETLFCRSFSGDAARNAVPAETAALIRNERARGGKTSEGIGGEALPGRERSSPIISTSVFLY
jgi:hypothetical protein